MSVREQIIDLIREAQGQAIVLGVPKALVDFLNGDHLAALLLNQMLYWTDITTDPDGWFYKSYSEWEKELGLSAYQVRRRVEGLLKPVGVEVKKRKGRLPSPTLHYRVQVEKLTAALREWLRSSTNLIVECEVPSRSNMKSLEDGNESFSAVDGEEPSGTLTETPSPIPSSDSAEKTQPAAPVVAEADEEEEEIRRAREAWEIAHLQMKVQLDRVNFETYLRDAHFIHKNGVFEIGVPGEYARQMLQHRLYRDVRRILSDCYGQPVEVRFVVSKQLVEEAAEEEPLFRRLAREAWEENPYSPTPLSPYTEKGGKTGRLSKTARRRLDGIYGADRVAQAAAIMEARAGVRSPVKYVESVLKNMAGNEQRADG